MLRQVLMSRGVKAKRYMLINVKAYLQGSYRSGFDPVKDNAGV